MSMYTRPRNPYSGSRQKLVLAFDVGTTFTCASYSILEPGVVPTILHVTRFEQEPLPYGLRLDRLNPGPPKVPSLVRYDDDGQVSAVGDETIAVRKRECETDTPWFKLLLSSNTGPSGPNEIAPKIPPPTPGKTPVQVFSDFLSYLHDTVSMFITTPPFLYSPTSLPKKYLEESEWSGFEQAGQTHFVMTHPNGWGDAEREKMGKAALLAGLIRSEDEVQTRVSFVREGESSLYFCLKNGASANVFKAGSGVLVVDAGGATIDFSAYALDESGEWFDEIAPPQCHFQGSIFVTLNVQAFLEAKPKYAPLAKIIINKFDKYPQLNPPGALQVLSLLEDPILDLKLSEVTSFFGPSISCIVDTVKAQIRISRKPIKRIFLVGGFSQNEYLHAQLVERLEPLGLDIFRPLDPERSVVDGALSLYLDYPAGIPATKQAYSLDPLDTDTPNLAVQDWHWVSLSDVRRFLASFASDISHVLREWMFLLLSYVLLSL